MSLNATASQTTIQSHLNFKYVAKRQIANRPIPGAVSPIRRYPEPVTPERRYQHVITYISDVPICQNHSKTVAIITQLKSFIFSV